MKSKFFIGPFAILIQSLIQEKRALGFKYQEQERILKKFDELSMHEVVTDGLSENLVLSFIQTVSNRSASTQRGYLSVMRDFAKYLLRSGINAYVPDSKLTPRVFNGYIPYLFTNEEIRNIFISADSIPLTPKCKSAALLYPVLFRLLYGTGIRISEAINLKYKNVNLFDGVLKVKDTKTNRDKLVPLHVTLIQYMEAYSKVNHKDPLDTDYFFKSTKTFGKLGQSGVYHYFRKLLERSEIKHKGRGKGPRLHDLRHTFCVKSFLKLKEMGFKYYSTLPILATYMGHKNINATLRYLKFAQLMDPDESEEDSPYFNFPEEVSVESN